MIDSILERAYRARGPRYLRRALFIQQQFVYPLILLAIAGLSAYIDIPLAKYLRLALLGCALQLVYGLLSIRLDRRLTRPVELWIEGRREPESTRAAWRAAASLPWELLRRGVLSVPLGALLWVLYLIWTVDFSLELDLGVFAGALIYAGVAV